MTPQDIPEYEELLQILRACDDERKAHQAGLLVEEEEFNRLVATKEKRLLLLVKFHDGYAPVALPGDGTWEPLLKRFPDHA